MMGHQIILLAYAKTSPSQTNESQCYISLIVDRHLLETMR